MAATRVLNSLFLALSTTEQQRTCICSDHDEGEVEHGEEYGRMMDAMPRATVVEPDPGAGRHLHIQSVIGLEKNLPPLQGMMIGTHMIPHHVAAAYRLWLHRLRHVKSHITLHATRYIALISLINNRKDTLGGSLCSLGPIAPECWTTAKI